MKKKLIFYAPLGYDIPDYRCGGAELGCRKTLNLYRSYGFDVIVIDKPASAQGVWLSLWGGLTVPFLFVFQMIRNSGAPVHIVGFYRGIVYYEWLLMMLCQMCHHKVIYELRNGSMIDSYETGSAFYKKIMETMLRKPDVVLCQGQEYVDFINDKWGVERTYYPNFLMDDFVKPNNVCRPHFVNLIFIGRVTEQKNVDVVIKILHLVRTAGINAKLEIIGGYDNHYKKVLDGIIKENGVEEYVSFYGRKPFEFIAERLRQSHYFLFPSTEKQEGHSNSLTEAMGCGVVPIASRAGFNASICGNSNLVVTGIAPKDYADKIIKMEEEGTWAIYSNFVYQRVLQNYTESIVREQLISTIRKLYD